MAIVNSNGFEAGSAIETPTVSGSYSIQAVVKRSGGYALKIEPVTTGIGYVKMSKYGADGGAALLALTTVWMSGYFRYAAGYLPAAGEDEEIFGTEYNTGPVDKFKLRLDDEGHLNAYDSTATLIWSGTYALAADTWYRIMCKVGMSATIAPWQVDLHADDADDTLLDTGSGTANLVNSTNSYVILGKHVNRGGNSMLFYWDDVVIDSAEDPGPGAVHRMDPDGQGNYFDWSFFPNAGESAWQDVDDIPHNSDTDYLTTAVNAAAHTVTLESAASAGISGTIKAVKGISVQRITGAANPVKVRIRSGTTDSDNTGIATSAYAGRVHLLLLNPADAAAFETADLDGLEIGVVSATGAEARCTMLCVMVYFLAAAAVAATARARRKNTMLYQFRYLHDGSNPVAKTINATAGTVAIPKCKQISVQAIMDGHSSYEVAIKPVQANTGTTSKNSCAAVLSDNGVYESRVGGAAFWLAYRIYNGATVASVTSANNKLSIERYG